MISSSRRVGVLGAAVLLGGAAAGVAVRALAADEPKVPNPARVAAVRHLMAGVNAPRCGAMGELLKDKGPADDKAWAELALHAALLNECGHVLMENGRCPDNVWAEAAAALRKGSAAVFEAAGRKDLKAAQDSFKEVTASCAACHAKHKGKPAAAGTVAAAPKPPSAGDAAAGAPPGPRLASVRHLMAGINAPNCGSLSEALKNDGPKDDKAWQEVVRFAALLNEAGFLLMENKRCPDDVWKNAATDLREHAAKVVEAGGAKNLVNARNGFKGLTAACAACHQVHKKPAS
ncbi:MAG: hypothetical protein HRF43_02905 [Phycisphaerae bacterium]|jgi:cytochrome c553